MKLSEEFIWKLNHSSGVYTFSVSPKLSITCQGKDKTLKPDYVADYNLINNGTVYLKYVVNKESDINEVKEFTKAYEDAGLIYEDVWLMAEGGTSEKDTLQKELFVVDLAIKNGYRFCIREHIYLFKNSWAK